MLALTRASEKNTKIESEIKNIIHWEEIREMHRKIKWVRGKFRGESTSSIFITKRSGKQVLSTNKDDLKRKVSK